MARRGVRVGALVALLVSGCGPASLPAPTVAPRVETPPEVQPAPALALAPSPPPAVAPAPPPVAPPAPPPAPWAFVYHRACNDSITPPVLSLDGKRVASCGSLFAVENGRFLGALHLGLLAFAPGDRALRYAYDGTGLTAEGPSAGDRVQTREGTPMYAVVAADGATALSYEEKGDERLLVVRKLPSLERVRSTSLGVGPEAGAVGFLPDGREVVLTDYPCVDVKCDPGHGPSCRQRRCGDTGLFAVQGGAVVPLVPGLAKAALGAHGDLAAVVRKDGSAALIALPDGHPLAALPAPDAATSIDALAVSPAGDRVAVAVAGKLTVLARRGDAFVEVLSAPRHFTRELRFAADGRTLFTGDELAVYREGAPARTTTVLPYPVTLPKGFVALERIGDEWRVHGKEDRSWAAYEQVQAMYYYERIGVAVTVTVLDPEEVGPEGDAEAWAHRAAARSFPHVALGTAKERAERTFSVWGAAAGERAMELSWNTGGCDEHDVYARVAEHDGGVYQVEIEVPGGLPPARVVPWQRAFFDAPLGPIPGHPRGAGAKALKAPKGSSKSPGTAGKHHKKHRHPKS